MTHLHITAWVLGLILLFISYGMYKKGNKAGKILHMILRLDYLLLLYSGIVMLIQYFDIGGAYMGEAIVKALAGLWVISSMEMILVKASKSKPTKSFWIQLVIGFIIVLVLGFGRLPMGIKLF
ncbi:YisL family protein [Gracilibacillus alcaliphilus]|uniref:YisL family protein n=1 Tax=Gracilibacillus alcaliphilus TaxID=1401441 RepID=UPI0019566D34|nr:YisL family protein [Gracilibacillus alcaliphilus]MBM7675435.1 putative membrane protein SirB2 [Gracilibacillus alcaliphilus]